MHVQTTSVLRGGGEPNSDKSKREWKFLYSFHFVLANIIRNEKVAEIWVNPNANPTYFTWAGRLFVPQSLAESIDFTSVFGTSIRGQVHKTSGVRVGGVQKVCLILQMNSSVHFMQRQVDNIEVNVIGSNLGCLPAKKQLSNMLVSIISSWINRL